VTTGGDVFTTPLVANLQGNSQQTVIFGSDDGGLYTMPLPSTALHAQSVTRFATGGFVSSTPALLPRAEGAYDIIFGSWDGGLYCLRGDDPRTCRWQANTGHLIWSSPVVADLDGDGSDEIVVVNDQLHVFTAEGVSLRPFPLPLGAMGIGAPAVGDLLGSGELVIVAGADRLYVIRPNGSGLPGFPIDTGAPFWASPILADIDGDGRDEIVAGDYAGFLHVIAGSGEATEGFPRKLGSSIVSSPIAVDADHDGLLELIVCTFDGRVHVLPTKGKTSQWPSFRGPLGNGIQLRRSSAVATPAPQAIEEAPEPNQPCAIRNWRVRRKNFAGQILYELHVEVAAAENFQSGLLYFQRDGQWLPSPVLRNGSRLIARFPPFARWRKAFWYMTLQQRDGGQLRFPAEGSRTFRAW
jgi:hypothetical protein